MDVDLVVQGRIVTPDQVLDGGWLAVREGRIAAIGTGQAPPAATAFDAAEGLVLPGAIDGQTHAGSYRGLEGIASTTASAVAGGVTTIVDMPYDNPDPVNTPERLEAKIAALETQAHCDVALYATVMPGQDVGDAEALLAGGVAAFKISAFESSPTRFPRIPADQALDLMERLALTGVPIGLHNEDQEIVRARIARARSEGRAGIEAHSASRPPAAELAATAHFLELGATSGAHAHIVHITVPRGFQMIETYRAAGFHATGELCVHYLWFDPDIDGAALGPLMKVNPPIRPGMIEPLWRELMAGHVAFVSSDHSSWPIDNKNAASIFDAGAGVPGLETLLPALFTAAEARGLDAPRLVAQQLSERPALFFGLGDRKGAIRVGADADLAIFTRGAHAWDAGKAQDELRWSPFQGRTFAGRVTRTYLRGQLAWDGEAVVNPAGTGRYQRRAGRGWFRQSGEGGLSA